MFTTHDRLPLARRACPAALALVAASGGLLLAAFGDDDRFIPDVHGDLEANFSDGMLGEVEPR
jgi:hypothetical protein